MRALIEFEPSVSPLNVICSGRVAPPGISPNSQLMAPAPLVHAPPDTQTSLTVSDGGTSTSICDCCACRPPRLLTGSSHSNVLPGLLRTVPRSGEIDRSAGGSEVMQLALETLLAIRSRLQLENVAAVEWTVGDMRN